MLNLIIALIGFASPAHAATEIPYSPDAIELANVLKECAAEFAKASVGFQVGSATHVKPDSTTDIFEIRLIGGGAPFFGPPPTALLKITRTQVDRPSAPDRPSDASFKCEIVHPAQ